MTPAEAAEVVKAIDRLTCGQRAAVLKKIVEHAPETYSVLRECLDRALVAPPLPTAGPDTKFFEAELPGDLWLYAPLKLVGAYEELGMEEDEAVRHALAAWNRCRLSSVKCLKFYTFEQLHVQDPAKPGEFTEAEADDGTDQPDESG